MKKEVVIVIKEEGVELSKRRGGSNVESAVLAFV